MIEDPPLLRICRDLRRPAPDRLAQLRDAPTSHVVDAMYGQGAVASSIRPVLGDEPRFCRFVGPAIPCACGPDDNLALLAALAFAEPGDVLVVATGGWTNSAVLGDLVAGMAKNRGVVGLVTDGAVRDRTGLRAVGLPVFAAAVTPNSAARNGPGTVGLPVVMGGVRVAAGDVVVADEDGVVVIPAERLAEVSERLAVVRAAEERLFAEVADGLKEVTAIMDLLQSPRVHYVPKDAS